MAEDRLPKTDQQLGQALRALRGPRSLADIEASVRAAHGLRLSDSTLHRYENGEHVPIRYARLLDQHYAGGSGWVYEAVVRLNQGTWEPWRDETPKETHTHAWPQEYRGSVWIRVVPNPHQVGVEHTLHLQWGAWQRQISVKPGSQGIALTTDKAPDRHRVGITVRVSPLAHLLFGVDEMTLTCPITNIRAGWQPRD